MKTDCSNVIHLIFDYSHLYYKYKFKIESGMLKRLTYDGRDISKMYYSLRDIEKARNKYEEAGYKVSIHICMDSKTDRKKEKSDYKANRDNKLDGNEYSDIKEVEHMLDNIGYHVTKVEGYEADDLIYTLVNCIDENDKCVIYTNDSDILINVKDNVSIELYNSNKGTQYVSMSNFEQFARSRFKSDEFKYNMVMLYKSLVGDKTDNVSGVVRFGIKAFDKFVREMKPYIEGYEENFINEKYTCAVIAKACDVGLLSDEQKKQALDSLEMVKPRTVTDLSKNIMNCDITIYSGNDRSRELVYGVYEMNSLYK